MTSTSFAIPIVAFAVLVAWYAFQPQRLLINRQVEEAMPTAQGGLKSDSIVFFFRFNSGMTAKDNEARLSKGASS